VAKVSSSGSFVLAIRAGGLSYEEVSGLALDSSGNTYIAGRFYSTTADFGGTTLTSVGSWDAYVAKVSSSGSFVWAIRAGGLSYEEVSGLALDSNGNVYIAGYFHGIANFGGTTLTSAGERDVYVAKVSSSGGFVWANRAGGNSGDYVSHLLLDSSGNAYIAGYFHGTANFGGTTLTSAGGQDAYVAKVSSSGGFVWANRAGGNSGDYVSHLALDISGNSYIAGRFEGTANFGDTTLTSAGYGEVYVAKVSSSGGFVWAIRAGGSSGDYVSGLALDSNGNAYIAGIFGGTVDFGGTTLTSAGSADIYVAKVNSSGSFAWATRAGGSNSGLVSGLALDSSGNAYIAGHFQGTANFGGTTLTSAGNWNAYVVKVSNSGSFVWAIRVGGSSGDIADRLVIDSNGNIYIAGRFNGTATFGTTTLISEGDWDVFLWKVPAS
jgi:hypothetical protein